VSIFTVTGRLQRLAGASAQYVTINHVVNADQPSNLNPLPTLAEN